MQGTECAEQSAEGCNQRTRQPFDIRAERSTLGRTNLLLLFLLFLQLLLLFLLFLQLLLLFLLFLQLLLLELMVLCLQLQCAAGLQCAVVAFGVLLRLWLACGALLFPSGPARPMRGGLE